MERPPMHESSEDDFDPVAHAQAMERRGLARLRARRGDGHPNAPKPSSDTQRETAVRKVLSEALRSTSERFGSEPEKPKPRAPHGWSRKDLADAQAHETDVTHGGTTGLDD